MNNKKREVLLVGYSGHGFVAAEAILLSGYHIAGYLEKQEQTINPFGLKYLGYEGDNEVLEGIRDFVFFPAIGSIDIRQKIYESLTAKGLEFITAIHPKSNVSSYANIGNGTLVCQGACVNPIAEIGNGVIINTGSIAEHECRIGDYAHIGPGAVLSGNVHIGKASFIGANAVIKQGVKIGDYAVIGAGAVVLSDVKDNQIVAGNPARQISKIGE